MIVKFTIQRDGTITRARSSKRPAATPTLDIAALRAVLSHADSCRRCRPAFPNPTLDRSPQFSIPTMTQHPSRHLRRSFAAGSPSSRCRRGRSGAAAAAAQPPPAAPQQPSEISTDDQRRRRRAAAARRARLHRALAATPRPIAIAKTIGQVLWDDLNFEREFALIPRDIYATIPAATSLRRRAVRSLARAERRRRRRRHGAEDGDRRPRRGAAVQRARPRQAAFAQGVRRLGGEPAAATRTRSPTKSTSSSARCAAWRAPS